MTSCSSGRQLAGLAQNLVGNRHLADVVQKSAARNHLDLGRRDAHRPRQRDGVSGHALGVAFRLGILQVKRVAQCLKRHVVGVLQVFHRLAQHLGARPHHLLQILLVGVALLQRLPMLKRALHRGHQVFALKGLEKVVVSAAAHRVDRHADVVNGRNHDYRQIGILRMNALQQREPVALLHHDIGQNQLKSVLIDCLQGFVSARRQLTSYPWRSRVAAIIERTCASSSTTRTRAVLRAFKLVRVPALATESSAGEDASCVRQFRRQTRFLPGFPPVLSPSAAGQSSSIWALAFSSGKTAPSP